ncbi:MAG: LysR family transcriptional regulator [Paenalcaligenes sp.]
MDRATLNQVSDFDLRLLRVFKTVAKAGGFAAAESILGISRSAISMHMSDLEKRLGMRLCQRGRAGFSLTDQGREVLRASETVLAAIEGFRSEVNQLHHSLRGDFNIGLMNSLVTQPKMRITTALQQLCSANTNVRVNISMSTPGEIERGLLDGRLHVGALPLITTLPSLDYVPLYDEHSYLYCSNRHPLFADAATVELATLYTARAIQPNYRMPPDAIQLHHPLLRTATASDREAIAFLILTGEHIGFLPDHLAANWVNQGVMRALRPDQMHFSITLAAATRKGRRQNLIVDKFLEALNAPLPLP